MLSICSWPALQRRWQRHSAPPVGERGFTLVELLIALSLGLLVSGVILDALVGELGSSTKLSRVGRERAAGLRALELMRGELAQAQQASGSLIGSTPQGCGLSGRQVVLFMQTPQGEITYSLDDSPGSIWRKNVLMRCGPSYDWNGSLTNGQSSSVVLDGLPADGVVISQQSLGILRIKIKPALDNASANSNPDAICASDAVANSKLVDPKLVDPKPIGICGYAAVASFQ
jgi:prepilin-type N-terminal cleavage/methylation domain-containing protein